MVTLFDLDETASLAMGVGRGGSEDVRAGRIAVAGFARSAVIDQVSPASATGEPAGPQTNTPATRVGPAALAQMPFLLMSCLPCPLFSGKEIRSVRAP